MTISTPQRQSYLGFCFDDSWVKTSANQPEFQNMYILVNYAVGGWPGTPTLAEWPMGASDVMEVDWVRVWTPHSGITQTNWIHNGDGSWSTGSNWSHGCAGRSESRAREHRRRSGRRPAASSSPATSTRSRAACS